MKILKITYWVAAICMFGEMLIFGERVHEFAMTGEAAWKIPVSVFFVFLNLWTIEMCNSERNRLDSAQ
jgi:hypothetical protein